MDTDINCVRFKIEDAISDLKGIMCCRRLLEFNDLICQQADMQNDIEDFVVRLEKQATYMNSKLDKMMLAAVQYEQQQQEETDDE